MLSIIIPTYNEEENVERLVSEIGAALGEIGHEIIFVDDSTDRTPDRIEELMKGHPNVRMKHRTGEKGLATAVLCGFRIAEGEYLAVMDADLQHPPAILPEMYRAVESGADICIPSRLIPGGDDGGLDLYRKFVSGTARWIGRLILPCLRGISDPTGGLFMFRREVIEGADLRPLGWKIMIEVLAAGSYSRVVEIPYAFQQRAGGSSKLDSKATFQYLRQCMDLRRRAVRNRVTVERRAPAVTE